MHHGIAVGCTFDSVTWQRLKFNVDRGQYGPKIGRGAHYTAQVGMWWLYFKWQWLRDAHATMPGAQFLVAFGF